MNISSMKGKRVLVTGADGFIGSHLTERLVSMGADVSVLIRWTSDSAPKPALRNIPHLADKIRIITGNIANSDVINLIIKDSPQVIFHLAADAYVPNSFEHPIDVMETNLIGTLNVLHAAMALKDIEQIVCTSSSEVYGTPKYVPIDEDHPLNPAHPYGASKAAADRYAYAYWNTYHLPIAIIRPFNTYGPRHTYDVIPKFIKLALQNKELTIHGDGLQTRDFIYVDDMVDAFLLMGSDKRAIGEVVNFGTGKETTVNKLTSKIVAISNSKSKIVHIPERTSEVARLCCNYSKAKKLFDWEPKVSLDDGLRKNIDWERRAGHDRN
ncbi:MAG: GDP-mannose 4,6-dehydratase [Candidatus Aenigmarchaeota archaeon]|nr:GDP-mannose 4,6-dehydratase [Candidatus Aenigmarchaeota archaeon]